MNDRGLETRQGLGIGSFPGGKATGVWRWALMSI